MLGLVAAFSSRWFGRSLQDKCAWQSIGELRWVISVHTASCEAASVLARDCMRAD